VLSLATGTSYSVGAPGAATMSLAGNNIPLTTVRMINGLPTFNWSSTAGASYCVLYKNNLTDAAWLPASPNLIATGTTATWSDTTTGGAKQRFYVLMEVQ
jgi:hypothetical protein